MPTWRTMARSKAIHLSIVAIAATFVSRSETPQAGRRKTRRRPRPREEKREEKERERESIQKKGARPTDLLYLFFFYAGINGDIFKALLETTTKRSPSKDLSKKKTFINPLKPPPKKKKRTIERTMLATDVNGKAPFERLREFQRLAIARSLA